MMSFTDEEKRLWHEERKKREYRPVPVYSLAVHPDLAGDLMPGLVGLFNSVGEGSRVTVVRKLQ